MKTKLKLFLMFAIGIMIFPVSALAFEVKNGDTVEIAVGEVINDDILVAGGTIRVNGTVNGDIKAVGSIVEINGNVDGDVVATGSQVTIRGEISDDLYTAGGQVSLENRVGDNAMFAGGTISISQNAEVGRDVWVVGGMVNIDGNVGRNVTVAAGEVNISSEIGGDLGGSVEKLALSKTALVKGDLKYKSPNKVELQTEGQVLGITEYTPVSKTDRSDARKDFNFMNPWSLFFTGFVSMLIKMLGLILVGLFIVLMFKKEIRNTVDRLYKNTGASFGWGLVVMLLTPIIIVVLLITIIGWPVSLMVGAVYIIALYVAKVAMSVWLGESIVKLLNGKGKGKGKKKELNIVWSMVLGAIILSTVFAIPFLGMLIKCVVVMFGLGAVFMGLKEYFAKRK